MDQTAIERRISEFVTERFLYGERVPARTESLLEAGVLDSMTLVQLVAFIEESLGIKLGRGDLVLERFDTIAGMGAWLAARAAS